VSGQNEAETLDSGDAGDATRVESEAAQVRQRSTIGFPYNDLDDATVFANAIHDHVGHGDCDDNQLAAWVSLSPKSSGFRSQISAARMFGVIESDSGARHSLTPLGRQIVDPGQSREARVTAFLNVPLYKAAYDKYKGNILPPTAALELDFVRMGVAAKQKDRARAVFKKSAEQAGFFEHGKNRLVEPGIARTPPPPAPNVKIDHDGGSGGGGGGGGDCQSLELDPLLMELLRKVPTKDAGWNAPSRIRWFRTFAMNVSQVYDKDDSPIELKIDPVVAPGNP
jgi:hypothetical protein